MGLLAVIVASLLSPTPLHAKSKTRLENIGRQARERLVPNFVTAQVAYPPKAVTLVYTKSKKVLDLYSAGTSRRMKKIKSFAVLAASGVAGPKLRYLDFQVPEGVYQIELLNPNSLFHLSLKVNYPNADDRAFARKDHRQNLGGDIMIHGKAASIGCVAIGDMAIEEVFTLAMDTVYRAWKVIFTPVDFRTETLLVGEQPAWIDQVYQKTIDALYELPLN